MCAVPNATQFQHTKVHDSLAASDLPGHAGSFQTLREHRFAGGLGDAAADRHAVAMVVGVLHPACVFAEELIGVPKLFVAGLA